MLHEPRRRAGLKRQVQALATQFVSYTDRRIVEVTLDYVAQADDGSVWYFGESVSNYRRGVVANAEGSWLAGRSILQVHLPEHFLGRIG